jgi:sterol desaturase/sphingolipid hydroxylase (fatty acid hydroxylase superfamily)
MGKPKKLLKEAIRRSVVLLVIVAPLLAACWRVTEQRPLGALTFGLSVAVVGVLVLCEHWVAFNHEWGSALGGSKTDVFYVIIASVMDKMSFLFCITAVAAIGGDLAGYLQINLWPSGRSLGFQVVVGLLIADTATYFRHRLFHASSVLWRFHRIHHSVTQLYWIRSAYTHPLEQLCIFMAIMLPIALLGAGEEVVSIVTFVFGLSGLLQHANIDSRSLLLNYVFATPEVHRVHHCTDERRSHSNFSAFFVLMDLLFGTYYRPARAAAPLPVGLEGVTLFPRDFLTQLAMPFRRDPMLDGVGVWGRSENGVSAANEP